MTVKLYNEDPYLREAKTRIIGVSKGKGEGKVKLALDRTIFYPEGGGQPSDRGIIEGEGFRLRVEHVHGKGEVWHEGVLEGRMPKKGEEVRLSIDWEWRYENMRAHTGQHILSAIIKGLYGTETTGFQIFPEHNKIEIDYGGELSWDMMTRTEELANEVVWADVEVEIEIYNKLPKGVERRLRKALSGKVKPPIRVVRIDNVDVTPCGGTHVRSTREIGLIKVLRFYRKSRKLWRVEFATGKRALRSLNNILGDYWRSLDGMPNKNRPLIERVGEIMDELGSKQELIDELRRELWNWKGKALLDRAKEVRGVKVVAHVDDADMKDAQAFAVHLVDKNPGTVAVIGGRRYVLIARNKDIEGLSAVEVLRKALKRVGGRGGGSDNLAKGGGFRATPEEAVSAVVEEVKKLLTG